MLRLGTLAQQQGELRPRGRATGGWHRGSVLKPQDLRSPCWLLSREVKGMAGVVWGTWVLVLPQLFQKLQKVRFFPRLMVAGRSK